MTEGKTHKLLMLPRDHQKSAMAAYDAAWEITRNPAIRILYVSSTSNLAVKQLKFIKDILTSDIYRFYWPDMVNLEEGRREKWTESEISVDHPLRRSEAVRDPTIFAAGLTTNVVGMHCDKLYLDDIVTPDNAYTEEGREKTKQQYSLLASVEGTDSAQLAVGTRYHPLDAYGEMISMVVSEYNDEGEEINAEPLYDVNDNRSIPEYVEDRGDGTGEFVWPRQQRHDGKWFGFDQKILARKRAQYLDPAQFRSQYYNDPNDYGNASINRECFQYYNKQFLSCQDGRWFYKNNRLNVFAAVDFAYSLRKKSDYTAIVVVGVDGNQNYYVLDIDRFKTDKISEYFGHILVLHQKWDIRKLRAECTAAQQVIVTALKQEVSRHGLAMSIEDIRPTRNDGTKEERIDAVLQPKYNARQIWHYQTGNCQILEEELVLQKPPHDDVKDALAVAVDGAVAPTMSAVRSRQPTYLKLVNSKYGGFG